MALEPTDATAGGRPGGARRELTVAVLLTAVAGSLGLVAGSRTWLDLRVVRDPPLPPVDEAVAGAALAPLVPGLALVVLAGAAGLLATRRWGRVAVGIVVVAAGAGMLVAAVPWLGAVPDGRAQEVAVDVDLPAGALEVSSGTGALIAVLAGLVAVLLGLATAMRAWRWPVMGARYDAPAAGPPAAAVGGEPPSERETWEALDRGEDPTFRPSA